MEFIADLHIHSRFSRATSKDCCPEKLDFWARRKGIHLLGTGDFTHRAWRRELAEKLDQTGDGFYSLKPEWRINDTIIDSSVKFVVSGEISSIYKKNGRTRKIHNLILLPSLDAAEKLALRLETIGNLHADGRPILGLDSKILLAMTLDVCPEALFIPAHIWTPHFSVLGANSGFDSLEECFEDLTGSIYAVETGLSSDPPMNWRLSMLDRFALVSNSDAHSPSNLAREANVFATDCSYAALYTVLKNNDHQGFRGTIEFFPEEGKYHFDGHRACNIQWEPAKTIAAGGKCPNCGGKLTVGVLHRVEVLADRPADFEPPAGSREFVRLTTLPHVIAASLGCGVASVKVQMSYETLLSNLGPELPILRHLTLDDIKHAGGPLIAEGIRRVRDGNLRISAGFDGEYGVIDIFSDTERKEFLGQSALFAPGTVKNDHITLTPGGKKILRKGASCTPPKKAPIPRPPVVNDLNESQEEAVKSTSRTVMVIAGPGTGKTRTLVSRIANLITECNVTPESITAVTFTNKAANELRERLLQLLGANTARALTIGTFHGICLTLLRERIPAGEMPVIIDESGAAAILGDLIDLHSISCKPSSCLRDISRAKTVLRPMSQSLDETTLLLYESYQKKLASFNALDFDDLLLQALQMDIHHQVSDSVVSPNRFSHLLVDEFQDINEVQYALVRTWSGISGKVFVIGDPHQAIYGFRGASPRFFEEFRHDYPETAEIALTQNYRSPAAIVESAKCVIVKSPAAARHPVRFTATFTNDSAIRHVTAHNELSEAIFIAKEINRMVGGVDMIDAHRLNGRKRVQGETYGFSDIAVLFRTHRQVDVIERCLIQEGIAYRVAGRDEFLTDPSVSGMLSIMKFAANPDDILSLTTALRYCGESTGYTTKYALLPKRTISQLLHLMEDPGCATITPGRFTDAIRTLHTTVNSQPPHETVRILAEVLGTGNDEQVHRLIHTAERSSDLHSFLETITFGGDADILRNGKGRPHGDAVLLTTLHAAKGLEFPVVVICGVNDGILPLRDVHGETADIDEERRLFYVGITRARQELIFTTTARRFVFGESKRCEESPFVKDIDNQYIVRETFRPEPKVEQMCLL